MKITANTPTPKTVLSSAAPTTPQRLTLRQVLSSVRITPVAKNGFDLGSLDSVRLTSSVMDAVFALKQSGIETIIFFPLHQKSLEHVFSSPELNGLVPWNGTKNQRAIVTQPLLEYFTKRQYQLLGKRDQFAFIKIITPVSDVLIKWDYDRKNQRVIRIGEGVTFEQIQQAFATPDLPGVRFTQEGIYIETPKTEQASTPIPQQPINPALAAQLSSVLASYPETVAQRVKSAFAKPLNGILADAIKLCADIRNLDDKKPARVALDACLKQKAESIITQLDDSNQASQDLKPLVELMFLLDHISLLKILIGLAGQQNKMILCLNLCVLGQEISKTNDFDPSKELVEVLIKRLKAAFDLPLEEIMQEATYLSAACQPLRNSEYNKALVEACKGKIRQYAKDIIACLEDNQESSEKLMPLLSLLSSLGLLRFTEELLKVARSQNKLILYAALCLAARKTAGQNKDNENIAYFWLVEGQFNESLDADDEARHCYEFAGLTGLSVELYQKAIKRLDQKKEKAATALKQEFESLWQRARKIVKTKLNSIDHAIKSSVMSADPEARNSDMNVFGKGDNGKLINEIFEDCFKVAGKYRQALTATAEEVRPLAEWLKAKPTDQTSEFLRAFSKEIRSRESSVEGYSVIFGLCLALEDQVNLSNVCNEIKDSLLKQLITTMCKAKRLTYIEGFFLCLAIMDEGVIMPDEKKAMETLLSLPPRAYGDKGGVAHMFCYQTYRRLFTEPAKRIKEAAKAGKIKEAEAMIRELLEAAPENELNNIRLQQYLNIAEGLMEGSRLDLAQHYICLAKEIDPTSFYLHKTMANLLLQQKDFQRAKEEMEFAINVGQKQESLFTILAEAIQFYAYLSDEYEKETSLARGLELAQKFYAIEPNNVHNCFIAAAFSHALGKIDLTISWAEMFIVGFNKSYSTNDLAARTNHGLSDRDALVKLLEKHGNCTALIARLKELKLPEE